MKSAFHTRAHGKLLLTGEYFVLDGATALAMPVRFGQTLDVEKSETPGQLRWKGKNSDGTVWFEAEFELPGLTIINTSDAQTAQTLAKILRACQAQEPDFLTGKEALQVETQTDFPREWGLGTSSTLLVTLANWAGVNPYQVLFDTLGGSGYDIAAAAKSPILYRLRDGHMPSIRLTEFSPAFSHQLYFVYLGKKQNSREGIARYRERVSPTPDMLEEASSFANRFLTAKTLAELEAAMLQHEIFVAQAIDLPRAKDLYFNDFWGEVKSLGAWGGDFVLATSDRPEAETRAYFRQKGMDVFLPWREMV